MNRLKLDKKAKLKQLTNRQAINLAKADNSPLYEKYSKAMAIKNRMEKMIVKKYRHRALKLVKERLKSKK